MPRSPRAAALPARLRLTTCAAILAAGTAAALAACDGEATIQPNEETLRLAETAARAKTWTPDSLEPVTLDLEMPSSVARGGVLRMRIRLHNGTSRPIAIGLGRGQGFDVLVAQTRVRADSGAVWSPLKLYSTSGDVTITDPLPPGRDTTFEVPWPTSDDLGHSVPPGRYRVRATVDAELLKTRKIWTAWTPVVVTP